MTSVIEKLKKIEQETIAYSELIASEQWEELNEKTAKRQAKLESIFSEQYDQAQVEQIKSVVSRILEIDRDYASQVKKRKLALTNNVVDIRSKFKAASKYQNIHENT